MLVAEPERGRIIAARPGSPIWIDSPVGISSACPGASTSGTSGQARRSSRRCPASRSAAMRLPCAGRARARRSSACSCARPRDALRDLGDERAGELRACRRAAAALAVGVDEDERVVVARRSPGRCCRRSAARPFPMTRLARACSTGRGSRRRSRRYGASGAATVARMSGFSVISIAGPRRPGASDLLGGGRRRPPVGDAAVATNTSCRARAARRHHASAVPNLRRSVARRPAWAGAPARDEGHLRLASAAARDRKAHLAARQVGDAAHRIDGLEGRPGGDEHRCARPAAWAGRRRPARRSSSAASSMRPSPVSPQACSPLAGPSSVTIGAQLRRVALRRRVRPHLAVHRRRHEQRAGRDRPRQAGRGSTGRRPAVHQPGHHVGARRRDDDRVGAAGQVDVRHVVGLARIPLAREHAAAGQGLHRHRRDELLGRPSSPPAPSRRPSRAAASAPPPCRRCRPTGRARCASGEVGAGRGLGHGPSM